MTIVDERGFGNADFNCEVEYSIDRDAAMQVFLDAVATYS